MLLHELVDVSNAVADARGRLDKVGKLAQFLRRLMPAEIPIAVAYLSGSLPQGRIGIGWSVISQARAVAPETQASLELREVHDIFQRIATVAGAGAIRARAQHLIDLLGRATEHEQDFLVRLLSGELRQGAQEGVLTEAVAKAANAPAADVRQAAMMCGNLGEVASAALVEGASALSKYAIQLFRPVEPMLASPAESVAEALEAFGQASFELKLDGARIQVHKSGDEVRVFSRALRDVTAAVPEVVDAVRALPAHEIILDGEVLALRPDGTPLPFQETMRRFGRRLDVDRLRSELPLTPFFFDCLYADNKPLTVEPQRNRFAAMEALVGAYAVPHRVISDQSAATEFFDRAIESGHEGVMAKSLDAPYAAGNRGSAWLKIKNVRTLDLVVLAAEWGSGRRRGWLSNLHLGARDPERHRLVMLGKTFKGMTDALLEWQTAELLQREVRREGHVVFVRPELVVEIAFNDLQESPQYPGGLALRFARVKGYRPDKVAEKADTLQTLQEIYRSMTGREAPMPRP
ncbi:MAG: ATP-dependent DNA ligase [Vicinamibacterales bacterium]